jgi:hypothetical protein
LCPTIIIIAGCAGNACNDEGDTFFSHAHASLSSTIVLNTLPCIERRPIQHDGRERKMHEVIHEQ